MLCINPDLLLDSTKIKARYNRAGRIIDQLEAAGIVGPFEGSKARQVLIPDDMALEELLNNLNNRDNRKLLLFSYYFLAYCFHRTEQMKFW